MIIQIDLKLKSFDLKIDGNSVLVERNYYIHNQYLKNL